MEFQNVEPTLKKTVLIVDDHIMFQDGLVSLLKVTPDFEVVGCAASVDEAVERARALKPDIVLMDFNLPDGTGLDATRAILSEVPDTQIAFLTAYEADANLFAAIRMGAKGYMLKNVSTTTLISSLRALDRGEMAMSRSMASQVIDELNRAGEKRSENDSKLKRLSPREQDILHEIEAGASNLEIAEHLSLSINTVKHHVRSVLDKLEVKNRRQAQKFNI